MNDHSQPTPREDFGRDLGRVVGPQRELANSMRASVLAYAAQRTPATNRRRVLRFSLPRRAVAGAAIAATLALMIFAPWRATSPQSIAGDLNHDGQADILDAYFLARSIESGTTLESDADLDGNGRVNRQDVDRLMQNIVRIDGGSS